MLLLASTSDLIQIVTTSIANTDVHASWVDNAGGYNITPGRTNTQIATAATTTIVGSPAASTQRSVKIFSIRNRHASTSQGVTVQHTDGTTVVQIIGVSLAAGEELYYDEASGWKCFTVAGEVKTLVAGAPYLALTGGSVAGNLSVSGLTSLGPATATTPAAADNSTNIATTAFVANAVSTGGSGTYLPLTAGPSAPLTGVLALSAGTDPGGNTTYANLSRTRLRFKQTAGDETNAGVIDYGVLQAALSLYGAGASVGNRAVFIYDNLSVNGSVASGSLITSGSSVTSNGSSSAFRFVDRAATSTTWQLYANSGSARINVGSTDVFIVSSSGNVTIGGTINIAGITTVGSSIYFAGITSGNGPRLYGDANNIAAQLGTGNGGFFWYNNAGSQLANLVASGNLALAGNLVIQGGSAVQSTTTANLGTNRWWFKVNSGDEGAAGSIDYRGWVSDALSIVGAGTVGGSRKIYLYDNVFTNGTLTVTGTGSFTGVVSATSNFSSTGVNAGYYTTDRSSGRVWAFYGNGDAARINATSVGDVWSISSSGQIGSSSMQLNGGGASVLYVPNGGINIAGASSFASITLTGGGDTVLNVPNGGITSYAATLTGSGTTVLYVPNGGITVQGASYINNYVQLNGNASGTNLSVLGGNTYCAGIFQTHAGGDTAVYADNGGMTASAYNIGSDVRLKQNIEAWDGGLPLILALQPVSFEWQAYDDTRPDDRRHIGLVADEVKENFAEMVKSIKGKLGDDEADILVVDHAPLTMAMVNAFKEMHELVQSLTERIAVLEGK